MPLAECLSFGSIGITPLVQTSFLELSSDTTTTSTAYVDLITVSMFTMGGICLVTFSVGAVNSSANTNVRFQLTLDGVVQRGTKFRQDAGAGSAGSLCYRTAPAAGAHTFKIQWSVSAGTGRIRAATVNEEHAALLIEEIAR